MSYLNNTDERGSSPNQLVLFMALAMGGFALYTAFFAPKPEPAATEVAEVQEQLPSGDATAAPGSPATELEATNATVEEPFRIRNFDENEGGVTFYVTNVGGRVASAQIDAPEQYVTYPGEREILPAALACDEGGVCRTGDALQGVDLPLALTLEGVDALSETSVWEVDEDESKCHTVDGIHDCSLLVMNWNSPDGTLGLTRTYFADKTSSYGLSTTLRIRNNQAQSRTIEDIGLKVYGSWSTPKGGILNQVDGQIEGMCGADGRFRDRNAKKLDEVRGYDTKISFVGINERYFVSALLPRTEDGAGAQYAERCTMRQAPRSPDGVLESTIFTGVTTIAPNSEIVLAHSYVAAPKRMEYLKAYDTDLQKSVKFGMFAFLAYGIRWLLVFFYGLVGNWGAAILLLTFAIKIALLPVTSKSFRSMEKMKEVQPKIEELKKKYENDQQKLAEAQMRLFKEEGVNPLSGCLPLLLQMPIYFALYRTIFSSAELYHAPFLGWITDLSQADPYFVIPALTSALMLLQVRLAPQASNANPQMKMMQWLMPIMFIPVTLFLPAGLVLYIFANILLSMLQQLYIRRNVSQSPSTALSKSGTGAANKR